MLKRFAGLLVRTAVLAARRSPSLRHAIDSASSGPDRPASFALVEVDSATGRLLDTIPSQTTEGERRFLYQFFRLLWTGQGQVVEIGPFLGGTSRAIAMGMLENPRRDAGTQLYTFDRFQDYFDVQRLREYLQPLVDSRELSEEKLEQLGDRAPFIDIFRAVHEAHDYSECIRPSDHGVPDLPEQAAAGPWMSLPDGFETDAVFVDGCKSWYGTKYFMQLMAGVARPGAIFIFQDYGWFTCFWLPVFIETFADRFELLGSVDNTYAFSLTGRLSADEVNDRFPDTPQDVGADQLARVLDKHIEKARQRGDDYAVVRHTMHKAGALAYVGESVMARTTLQEAEDLPTAARHRTVLRSAWESPTYTPSGPVRLGRD